MVRGAREAIVAIGLFGRGFREKLRVEPKHWVEPARGVCSDAGGRKAGAGGGVAA